VSIQVFAFWPENSKARWSIVLNGLWRPILKNLTSFSLYFETRCLSVVNS
jgi:hypothetical protein